MEQDKRKIFTETDEDSNILNVWEGPSRKEDYSDEIKSVDKCYYIQINDSNLQKISFEAVKFIGFKLVDNCVYDGEKNKRKKELNHLLEDWY